MDTSPCRAGKHRELLIKYEVGKEVNQMPKIYKSWNDVPLILKVNDLTILLGIKKRTVQRKLEAGEIPGKKIGVLWMTDKSDLRQKISNIFQNSEGGLS